MTAIDRELIKDGVQDDDAKQSEESDSVRFARIRKEVFQGRKFPGNSVDILREAGEIRNKQMDAWLE